ncbi:hypothetical protein Cgig2_016834 [Carnegiea gigantea]|uniref:Uncharacterized protein n=1 Tax=Carnegiea gigantea TaxID=171969 RepID=A0A9Q1K8G8_9CARY|nr:hypothetical protein Cgig2_016834 [Carnegiea gigantea]
MFSTPYPFVFLAFTLILSLPLIFILMPHFLPPKHVQISLSDELDDLTLFRRAILASSSSSSSSFPSFLHRQSSISKPKIAFLFLIDSDIHFSPLWELFFHNHHNLFNVYIHGDPSRKIPLTGIFSGREIVSRPTERGSPTLISAERRLLATALIDDPLNMYFALISPSCIPLHSFPYIYRILFPAPIPRLHKMISFIEIIANETIFPERYNARGKDVMVPEVPYHKFRGGSQFFVLARNHALMVIQDHRLWRKFRLPCINWDSCYPEEHYFSTLLSMEDPAGCSHFTLTRVNWTGSFEGHPHTYKQHDISPELIYHLRQSNSTHEYLFARKFSPDCLSRLMNISETDLSLLFKDESQTLRYMAPKSCV